MKIEMRQRVMDLVDQLPQEMLPEAIEFIQSLSIKAKGNQLFSSPDEQELISIIQTRLALNEQQRFDYLRERQEQDELTDADYLELIKYIEKIEDQDVRRTSALIKLSQLSNISLDSLIKQFPSL
jgi:hypothetical protein